MNAADVNKSDRLSRVDNLLASGREFSTLEIIAYCGVCAVNSIIAELRENGRDIRCRREGKAWYYKRVQHEANRARA